MAKRPWRTHHTRDWATDPFVRSLALDARAVYFELLDIAWEEGGLQQEWVSHGTYVAQRIGISRRKFVTIWPEIRGKFVEYSPGIWSNPRLENERTKSEEFSEKQAKAGKLRHQKPANAQPEHQALAQPLTVTTQSQSQDREKEIPDSPTAPRDDFDFDAVYALYPRKEGRKKGLARCRSSVKSRLKYDALLQAVKNYAATVTDVTYAKHFDTFMNCWEDYVDAAKLTPSRHSVMDPASQEKGRSLF